MILFCVTGVALGVARGRRKSNSSVAESAAVAAASELATIDMPPDTAVVAVRGTNDDLVLSMKQAKPFPFTPALSPRCSHPSSFPRKQGKETLSIRRSLNGCQSWRFDGCSLRSMINQRVLRFPAFAWHSRLLHAPDRRGAQPAVRTTRARSDVRAALTWASNETTDA